MCVYICTCVYMCVLYMYMYAHLQVCSHVCVLDPPRPWQCLPPAEEAFVFLKEHPGLCLAVGGNTWALTSLMSALVSVSVSLLRM